MSARPIPGPYAFAVQVIVIVGPANEPPVGAVITTSGWSRSTAVVEIPTSHRRTRSSTSVRIELATFRSARLASSPVSSKAKYPSRDGVPPQTPDPAVPLSAEDTQRRPFGWLPGLHPWT